MNIILSNTSQEPIYEQIYKQIRKAIICGDLAPGELLPSIRSLARELQISVITTKRAYEELERDGYIQSVAGKGSYVAPQNQELLQEKRRHLAEEKMASFVEEARLLGMSLEELHQILDFLYREG